MTQSLNVEKRIRKDFGNINFVATIPNLIDMQKQSYIENFLQFNTPESDRLNVGLQSVFNFSFPITDQSNMSTLEFVKYSFGELKYDVIECIQRAVSYVIPLKVTLRLIVWDIEESTAVKEIKGIKEQEVYLCDIPLMTPTGTFIVNGTERVVISQMHRSPGIFFYHDDGKANVHGKYIYSARIIPYRGSWLDFEFDAKDIVYFRIDRKRKLYATTLLMAIGMSSNEIIDFYYDVIKYDLQDERWVTAFNSSFVSSTKLLKDLINADTKEVVLEVGQRITARLARKLSQNGLNNVLLEFDCLLGKFLAKELINSHSGEILAEVGEEITDSVLALIKEHNITIVNVLAINDQSSATIRNTLFIDKNKTQASALADIFKVLRPGEPANFEASQALLHSLFFDYNRYDLSEVGRIKMNMKLDLEFPENQVVLTNDDIKYAIKVLVDLKDGQGQVDDIDHLGNRRVRSVGELVENQCRIGLMRMSKAIFERLSSVDIDTVMPYDIVNAKVLVSALKEFFGTSQLSQFMDQTNPLSEVTHKRRLSALGPGGLSRERAGFEVRDVHPTHYGRICPIETPEGQNIGLISSMATYTKINKYGFIESPYRRVSDGVVTDEIVYLSAIEEGKYKIAQANVTIDKSGQLQDDLLNCRTGSGSFVLVPIKEVDFIDIGPMQVVSIAASLIPFLENDDANRALMGSNMQRQAVSLITSAAPFVGTGIEKVIAKDSGSSIVSLSDGIVEQVEAFKIIVRSVEQLENAIPKIDIYNLLKFQKSNHNTCINQKPLVNVGDFVSKGQILADGPSTDNGEISLGKNVLVTFVPWNGYNFEDSILISEHIVKDDIFTSVHIEAFEVVSRDTRLGPEEITRDIPNVSDKLLMHLDESGIAYVGAEVKPGDILVGKVTPKSEAPMTSEEKLLRAIFGEKAADIKDTSLHVPPGISGTVVEVRVFSRRGIEKDERTIAIEQQKIEQFAKDRDDELRILEDIICQRLRSILIDQVVVKHKSISSGTIITDNILTDFSKEQLWSIVVEDANIANEVEYLKKYYGDKKEILNKRFNDQVQKFQNGDELPQGTLKMVKIFIATKHKLQPGDKMAGRHGNKGVVSRILPEEDMPFLEDGTIVDVVLNPLGLPSRMNVGQILETHLGWASFNLGKRIDEMLNQYHSNLKQLSEIRKFIAEIYKNNSLSKDIYKMSDAQVLAFCDDAKNGIYFSTPVFDGAKIDDIKDMLKLADQNPSGQSRLIDGRTGEYFDRNVTVGYKYLLKLHHLVDDKIHARSIGPYSLVTQQPLGGKSHFGGQRFGEMECWALEAYGAAFTLQEILTIKADDVVGRIKAYSAIVRGDTNFNMSIPESFNVMIKEFRSLCLNVQLIDSSE